MGWYNPYWQPQLLNIFCLREINKNRGLPKLPHWPKLPHPTLSYDLHLWYTCMCKRIGNISRHSFHFFQCWFSGSLGVGGRMVKVQKMVQNDKKFCPSCSISQELYYIISLSFMVHMCKMIISPGFLFVCLFFCFIFSKFWFFGLLR